MKLAQLALVMPALFACGYRPVYGGSPPEARLAVVAAPATSPEADALAAVLTGLRGELARQGALRAGAAYPHVVVEVLRVDELPLGMIAEEPPGGGDSVPGARGMTLAVTARAWVMERAGVKPTADTGDMRRLAHSASKPRPEVDLQARIMAIRAAGNEVGEALARRVLGEASPSIEPL